MIVLDSSAACEIGRDSDIGHALRSLMLIDEEVVSCELICAEVASVFRKFIRTKKIDVSEAKRQAQLSVELVDKLYSLEPLQTEALNESIRLDHSSYDMFYFILARRLGATLFTTDKKLAKLCLDNGVNCIAEAEF